MSLLILQMNLKLEKKTVKQHDILKRYIILWKSVVDLYWDFVKALKLDLSI